MIQWKLTRFRGIRLKTIVRPVELGQGREGVTATPIAIPHREGVTTGRRHHSGRPQEQERPQMNGDGPRRVHLRKVLSLPERGCALGWLLPPPCFIGRSDGEAASHWDNSKSIPSAANDGAAGVISSMFAANIVVARTIPRYAWFVIVRDNGTGVVADDSPSAREVKDTRHTMFNESGGGTALNTTTRAATITGLDKEWDRRSPVARPTVYSNRRTGAARKFNFATSATARDTVNQGVRSSRSPNPIMSVASHLARLPEGQPSAPEEGVPAILQPLEQSPRLQYHQKSGRRCPCRVRSSLH